MLSRRERRQRDRLARRTRDSARERIYPARARLKRMQPTQVSLSRVIGFFEAYLNVAREESSGGAGTSVMTVVTATR